MLYLILYIITSLANAFLRIFRIILVNKSGKFWASVANCAAFTFAALVVKFIAESDWTTATIVEGTCSFFGCYLAMWAAEKITGRKY